MVSPLHLKYIENALQKGYSEEQIKQALQSQGVSALDVENAFKEYKSKNDFLASNVASNQNAPQPPKPPVQEQQPKWQVPGAGEVNNLPHGAQSRMQYAPKSSSSSKMWLGVALFLLIIVGAGAAFAYYNYSEEIMDFFSTMPKNISESPNVPNTNTPVVNTPPQTQTPEPQPVLEEPEPELSLMGQKLANVLALEEGIKAYFEANSFYPQSIENTDADGFYCYRKEGTHYIIGTILNDSSDALAQAALANDLDGSYYCGNAVKDCADPVFCLEP